MSSMFKFSLFLTNDNDKNILFLTCLDVLYTLCKTKVNIIIVQTEEQLLHQLSAGKTKMYFLFVTCL